MHFNNFIKLVAPFHNARLVAAYHTDSGIQAQISTGLADFPFIAINDSQVTQEDVWTVLDMYDTMQWEQEQETQDPFAVASNTFSTPENCWGLEPTAV